MHDWKLSILKSNICCGWILLFLVMYDINIFNIYLVIFLHLFLTSTADILNSRWGLDLSQTGYLKMSVRVGDVWESLVDVIIDKPLEYFIHFANQLWCHSINRHFSCQNYILLLFLILLTSISAHRDRDIMVVILQTKFLNSFPLWKLIEISHLFIPRGQINKPEFVPTMAWCWAGDKPLAEKFIDAYMSLGIDELTVFDSQMHRIEAWTKLLTFLQSMHFR